MYQIEYLTNLLHIFLKSGNFTIWNFYINHNVLIPRQDTELLVDLIIKKYDEQKKIDILDLGTGSGAIGIALGINLKMPIYYLAIFH